MNLVDQTTTKPAVIAVKPGTPSGAYNDPAAMGAMIQKMYPQYASFDAATLGQRWISLHTPAAAKGTGTGAATDTLQAPTNITQTPNQKAPDLSGLGKYATPIQPQAPKIIIGGLGGNGAYGAQLTPMTQPTQYSAPQQKPQGLSVDISKLKF